MTKYVSMKQQPFSGYNVELCAKEYPEHGYAAFYHTQFYAEPSPDSEIIVHVEKIAEANLLHDLMLLVEAWIINEDKANIDEGDWDLEWFTGREDEEDIL